MNIKYESSYELLLVIYKKKRAKENRFRNFLKSNEKKTFKITFLQSS